MGLFDKLGGAAVGGALGVPGLGPAGNILGAGFGGKHGVSGLPGGLKDAYGNFMGSLDRSNNRFSEIDPEGNLSRVGAAGERFGRTGEAGFSEARGRMTGLADRLDALGRGEDSLAAEQLRQGLQQNLAAQQSAAAGAAPQNAAMAARNAAIQGGRLGSALSGQQAIAGIQERHAANQAQAGLLSNMRGQDLQAALGGQRNAINAFGGLENARTARFQGAMQTPTNTERLLGMGMGLGSMAFTGGASGAAGGNPASAFGPSGGNALAKFGLV